MRHRHVLGMFFYALPPQGLETCISSLLVHLSIYFLTQPLQGRNPFWYDYYTVLQDALQ